MEYYKQQSKGDCRIACLATMLQFPFDDLVLCFKPDFRKFGVSDQETKEVLHRLGYTMRLYNSPGEKVYIDRKASILSVPSLNNAGHTHSIFWTGFDVYDPSRFDRYKKLPVDGRIFRVIQVDEKTPWDGKILMKPVEKKE